MEPRRHPPEPGRPGPARAGGAEPSGGRRSRIVDVARLAGVSRQTVSNVLNGNDAYFSAQTRRRVEEAMAALSYRPNRAAQSLRSQRTLHLGYHMAGDQLEAVAGFTLSFLQALIKAAAAQGYSLTVFTHQPDGPVPMFQELIARRSVDAFIIDESQVDDPRARVLAAAGVPFASFGRLAADLPQQWVDVDNVAGMAALVDYLVAAGHRRFAFLRAAGDEYWKHERLAGLREGLRRHGLDLPAAAVYAGPDDGIRAKVRTLAGGEQPPTVIVTGSDSVAAVALNVCHALGLEVGAQIAVTGFDGGAIGMLTEPTLTSVRIPVERIAQALVARCLDEMRDGPTGRPGLLVATEIVRGRSA